MPLNENSEEYLIEDRPTEKYYRIWKNYMLENIVNEVLKDISIYGQDPSHLKRFCKSGKNNLSSITNNRMKDSLKLIVGKKQFQIDLL